MKQDIWEALRAENVTVRTMMDGRVIEMVKRGNLVFTRVYDGDEPLCNCGGGP